MAEEVNLLKELNETYKNHRFPNVEISKFLTTDHCQDMFKECPKKLADVVINNGVFSSCQTTS